jgi:hypothetical protein
MRTHGKAFHLTLDTNVWIRPPVIDAFLTATSYSELTAQQSNEHQPPTGSFDARRYALYASNTLRQHAEPEEIFYDCNDDDDYRFDEDSP